MRFGKIEYLNLLPFDVFIKKYPAPAHFKAFLEMRKSYPSRLNKDFLYRRIDAGFISSIAGYESVRKRRASCAGIVAKGAVWSVLALPKAQKDDYQSASSNALAKILGISGEILIGDRALKYKLNGGVGIDLGEKWWEKHHLGFSFGRLCFNQYAMFYRNLALSFVRKRVKIPYYILQARGRESQIASKDILRYLAHIHYRVGKKEEIALRRFYAQMRLKGIKKPMRF
ncbi:MqnA/MqnD/SBP family protein [Helicobacter marmotae]|uniref:Chorismate dehydratase n=1 Tax=Helicobacter marmotae TaxID=152490 RepID=A0A3D8I7K0_9HELI|nr:MqnA/MqnD/SBP family protein [Helicobacter marmotae]RDU61087.1 menaquinone biosynthesis protein [Helicobacter marmotae]